MSKALLVNRVLLTLLSISTGGVKIAKMEEEMTLFADAGFSDGATVAFGVVQLVLGVLLIPNRTTRGAAWGMAATFVVATGVLFKVGMIPFGVVSLLFIASAVLHAARGAPE